MSPLRPKNDNKTWKKQKTLLAFFGGKLFQIKLTYTIKESAKGKGCPLAKVHPWQICQLCQN